MNPTVNPDLDASSVQLYCCCFFLCLLKNNKNVKYMLESVISWCYSADTKPNYDKKGMETELKDEVLDGILPWFK